MFRLSQGVPRVINVICDRALLGAYSLDRHRVTAKLVRSAAGEVFGRRFAPHWLPWALTAASAVALAAAMTGVWNYWSQAHAAAPLARTAPAAAAAAAPAAAAEGTAAAAAAPAKPAAPPAARLADLLAQHHAETDTDSAFGKLFGLWGAKYQPSGTDPCTQAGQQGLECLTERGSFGQLRLYNRPAILLLNDATAAPATRWCSRRSMTSRRKLDLGGTAPGQHRRAVALLAGRLRDAVAAGQLARQGAVGRHARRTRCAGCGRACSGCTARRAMRPASDVFDADLTALVRDFQRQHQLTVDGIAGVQTQIALAGALAGPGAPLLSAADTHHGG